MNDIDYITLAFGTPHGLLAQHIDGYERRDGQFNLAQAIDWTIRGGNNLVAEGPCGVGKSLAALIPAVYNHKRTLYVTATIALQEQLVKKDLPLVQRAIRKDLRFMLLKGRSNYLCLRRSEKYFEQHGADSDVASIEQWAEETYTGDKSDLPYPCPFWSAISSTFDQCLSTKCKYRWKCWTTKAREGLEDAHIIVTNYHMLLVNAPEHDVLICDEAHKLVDIARDVLGWELKRYSARAIIDWLRDSGGSNEVLAKMLDTEMQNFFQAARAYLGKRTRARIRDGAWFDSRRIIELLNSAATALGGHKQFLQDRLPKTSKSKDETAAADDPNSDDELDGTESFMGIKDDDVAKGIKHDIAITEKHQTAAVNLMSHIQAATTTPDADWVVWLEDKDDRIICVGKPLDVSGELNQLYSTRSIMMSATLASQNSFGLFRRESGAPPTTAEIIIPSPFDHAHLAALVVPATMAQIPKGGASSDEWLDSLAVHLGKLIRYCGGQTMGLFTAKSDMVEVAERLRDQNFNILCQGERSSHEEVIEALKLGRVEAILGVDSFWTGVDIPGPPLSGLFINRLPFGVPDDPLNAALDEAIKARGGDHFHERVIPTATIRMRQGVGRLIRSTTDTGVIMVADRRLTTRGWCAPVLRSLPPYRIHGGLPQLQAFLGGPK